MNFENREIDDKKLLEEIDSLDSDFEVTEKKDTETNEEVVKTDKKRKSNFGIIILLVVVLIAYLCYEKFIKDDGFKYLYNKSTNETKTEQTEDSNVETDTDEYVISSYINIDEKDAEERNKFNEAKKQVEINIKNENEYGEMLIQIKNNSNYNFYDFRLCSLFYDKDGEVVDIEDRSIKYLKANSEVWVEIYTPLAKYDKCDFALIKDYFVNLEVTDLTDDVKYDVTENKEKGNLYINIENTSNHDIYQIQFIIEYLDKNGNVMDIDLENQYNIKAGEKATIESYSYGLMNDENYSKYNVKLISAMDYE